MRNDSRGLLKLSSLATRTIVSIHKGLVLSKQLSVLNRVISCVLFKTSYEIRIVVESAFRAYLQHGHVCVLK